MKIPLRPAQIGLLCIVAALALAGVSVQVNADMLSKPTTTATERT